MLNSSETLSSSEVITSCLEKPLNGCSDPEDVSVRPCIPHTPDIPAMENCFSPSRYAEDTESQDTCSQEDNRAITPDEISQFPQPPVTFPPAELPLLKEETSPLATSSAPKRPRMKNSERKKLLDLAVHDVISQNISMRKAAQRYNLAKSSLCDYVRKNNIELPSGRNKTAKTNGTDIMEKMLPLLPTRELMEGVQEGQNSTTVSPLTQFLTNLINCQHANPLAPSLFPQPQLFSNIVKSEPSGQMTRNFIANLSPTLFGTGFSGLFNQNLLASATPALYNSAPLSQNTPTVSDPLSAVRLFSTFPSPCLIELY
ncbi:hypothetical protein Ciccas_000209 [Cichlidogyrus casuarinus]|uniref:HTH psq-type domain-containing protein n=1 Tax=Cichlidogyrus casuarinus TaxID=1844966 RepID=A0ABD2QNU0_9PLAT